MPATLVTWRKGQEGTSGSRLPLMLAADFQHDPQQPCVEAGLGTGAVLPSQDLVVLPWRGHRGLQQRASTAASRSPV